MSNKALIFTLFFAFHLSSESQAQSFGSIAPSGRSEKWAFNRFSEVALKNKRCQLMAFRLPKDDSRPTLGTWDTSEVFRVWCKLGTEGNGIEQIWLDWSVEGHVPTDPSPVADDLLIIDRIRHKILVESIGTYLKGRLTAVSIQGKAVQETDFPEKPVFCNPPRELENLVIQAVRLGELARREKMPVIIGMIDCQTPNVLQFPDQLFVLARVGDKARLLTNNRRESFSLIFCEPQGVVLPPLLMGDFWSDISASANSPSA